MEKGVVKRLGKPVCGNRAEIAATLFVIAEPVASIIVCIFRKVALNLIINN